MSTQVDLGQQDTPIYGDGVVPVGYALLLMVAVVFFLGACFSLKAYLPDLERNGLTLLLVKQTPAMMLYTLSMLLVLPTTIILLCRCIWSSSEVSFFSWTVVLIGGVLSYIYIVFGLNWMARIVASWLSPVV